MSIFKVSSTPANPVVAITSSTQGFLKPKLTTAQRNAMGDGITSPATGLEIFNTELNVPQTNTGTPLVPIWLTTIGSGYAATSTDAVANVPLGSKSFTTQKGLAYLPGSRIRLSSASPGLAVSEGTITSYDNTTGAMVVNLTDTIAGGAGNFTTPFSIAITGEKGQAGPSGTGNVVGPSSATDNAIVRFDLTTGKLIKNSGVIIDNSNNVTIPGNLQVNGRVINKDFTQLFLLMGGH